MLKAGWIPSFEPTMFVFTRRNLFLWITRTRDITERKAQQKALAESEQRLHTLVDNLPGVAFRCLNVRNWTMQYLSDRCEELFGYTAEEFINDNKIAYGDLIDPDHREYVWEVIQDAIENQLPYTLSYMVRRADGQVRWVEEKGKLLTTEETPEIIEGYIEDVTESRQTETALQQNEANLREAQRIAHLGSWIWDIPTGNEIWSDEEYRRFGYEPGSVPATYDLFLNSLHPDDRPVVEEAIQKTLKTDLPLHVEYRVIWPDNSEHWLEARGKVDRDDAGNPIRMSGTVLDITARKVQEQALSESELRYRTIVDNIPGTVYRCAIDKHWTILTISDHIEKLSGYAPSDFVGNAVRSYASIIHPDDVQLVEDVVMAGVDKHQPYTINYRVVDRDGIEHHVYERSFHGFSWTRERVRVSE